MSSQLSSQIQALETRISSEVSAQVSSQVSSRLETQLQAQEARISSQLEAQDEKITQIQDKLEERQEKVEAKVEELEGRLRDLQACDHELKIRFVDASHPAACHDSFVWNKSEVRRYFEGEFATHRRNIWLLGDAGYPLEPWIMTPYRTPEDGSTESRFNEMHSKCRNIIERTNGVLKARRRWILSARELHYSPEKAAKVINVCCCLHNICIHFKVDILEDHIEDEIRDMEPIVITSKNHMEIARSIRSKNCPRSSRSCSSDPV
ncbi:PREDICTED: putative nuclease HARBI1 [Rhagoletis zephyria]|uniref:putative nuclease HARBI1 n=1 Tax=Rhagoletis zephyria TaxID=28612 RepID=UPI000811608F|nr:PREDICTED: putative nuclease HARBI1 [Rhagoletis zephyria]